MVQVFRSMITHNIPPSIGTFGSLLSAASHSGSLVLVKEVTPPTPFLIFSLTPIGLLFYQDHLLPPWPPWGLTEASPTQNPDEGETRALGSPVPSGQLSHTPSCPRALQLYATPHHRTYASNSHESARCFTESAI